MTSQEFRSRINEARSRILQLSPEMQITLNNLIEMNEEAHRDLNRLQYVIDDELTSARLIAQYALFEQEAQIREAVKSSVKQN